MCVHTDSPIQGAQHPGAHFTLTYGQGAGGAGARSRLSLARMAEGVTVPSFASQCYSPTTFAKADRNRE